MNWLDIVVISVMALTGFMGWRLGIIKPLFGVGGTLAGIYCAFQFYINLSANLTFIENESIKKLIAFILIVVLIVFVFVLLANFLLKLLSFFFLAWIDRSGGVVLGLFVGVFILSALILLISSYDLWEFNQIVSESILGKLLQDFGKQIWVNFDVANFVEIKLNANNNL